MITWFKRAFTGHPGVEGIAGAPGPQGPQGPQGPKGDPGVSARTPRAPKFSFTQQAPIGHELPIVAYAGDAGHDLATTKNVVIRPGEVKTVSTGVCVDLDQTTVGLIFPRSSIAKGGINTLTGVVDSGYTGELKVTLHNTTARKRHIDRGTRIAQLVVTPVVTGNFPFRKQTERGNNGFGSSGKGNTCPATAVAETKAPAKDMVNHPPHYAAHPVFTRECHYYSKYMTFDQGNAFKYLWRCAAKGDMHENLNKAVWYLNAMLTGPVVFRYGNVLREELTNQLIMDMASAVAGVNSPSRYLAALEAYWACGYLAEGKTHKALAKVHNALTILDGVK